MSVCHNIEVVAQTKGISIKELSRKVNIPYTTLYNALRRNSERFDLTLLNSIAQELDVSVGTLLSNSEPSLVQILNDCYGSNREITDATPKTTIESGIDGSSNENSNSNETSKRYPFDSTDKRDSSLRNFDQLNSLGQKVAVQMLLTIMGDAFKDDLRRQFIFLLKHSNDRVIFNFNNALTNLTYLASFNDQYVTPSFTDLLKNLSSDMD